MNPATYIDFIKKELNKNYRKTSATTLQEINIQANLIININLDNRTKPLRARDPHFTIKDHKPDFPSKPPYASLRLIWAGSVKQY